jgi:hypothetical protein
MQHFNNINKELWIFQENVSTLGHFFFGFRDAIDINEYPDPVGHIVIPTDSI